MRIGVDEPRNVGGVTVATLSARDIQPVSTFGFASLSGRKTPLAVLLRASGKATALHLDGAAMTLPELKALCRKSPEAKKALTDFGFRL